MWSLGCCIAVTVFLSAMASASSKPLPLEIKVLKAESYTFKSPPIVPRDCNWQDLSAYCYGSKPVGYVENTVVVQEPDGRSLQIACTAYNRWSHCTDLPVNSTFDAKMESRGLEIRYRIKTIKCATSFTKSCGKTKEVVECPAAGLIALCTLGLCRNWRFKWLVSTDLKCEMSWLGERLLG
jgi:hypothetical protein